MKTHIPISLRYAGLPLLFLVLFVLQQQFPEIHTQGALWSDHPRWWQFFTCNFLSGNWTHLAFNMFGMITLHSQFGPRVRLPMMFLLFTLFSAVSASLYFLFFMSHHAWLVGASGGVYTVIGFFGWFQRRWRVCCCGFRALSIPMLAMLVVIIGIEALIAHFWVPQLAWPMHAVGMGAGFIAALSVQAIYLLCSRLTALQKMIHALELREPVSALE